MALIGTLSVNVLANTAGFKAGFGAVHAGIARLNKDLSGFSISTTSLGFGKSLDGISHQAARATSAGNLLRGYAGSLLTTAQRYAATANILSQTTGKQLHTLGINPTAWNQYVNSFATGAARMGTAAQLLTVAASGVDSLSAAVVRGTTRLASLTAIGGAIGTGFAIKLAADNELAIVSFTAMLKSAEKAQKLIGDLRKFAAETPLQFPETRDAARQLVGFGFAAEEVVPTLRMLGDLGATVGSSLGDLTYLFGTARTEGRLYARDLNQFLGRGADLLQPLANQLGIAKNEVRRFVEEGGVQFEHLAAAIKEVTSAGGIAFNMMEVQSKTLIGRWSTLIDEIKELGITIGTSLLPSAKAVVNGLREWFHEINRMNGELPGNTDKITQWGLSIVAAAAAFKLMPGPPMLKVAAAAGAGGATWITMGEELKIANQEMQYAAMNAEKAGGAIDQLSADVEAAKAKLADTKALPWWNWDHDFGFRKEPLIEEALADLSFKQALLQKARFEMAKEQKKLEADVLSHGAGAPFMSGDITGMIGELVLRTTLMEQARAGMSEAQKKADADIATRATNATDNLQKLRDAAGQFAGFMPNVNDELDKAIAKLQADIGSPWAAVQKDFDDLLKKLEAVGKAREELGKPVPGVGAAVRGTSAGFSAEQASLRQLAAQQAGAANRADSDRRTIIGILNKIEQAIKNNPGVQVNAVNI